MLTEDPLKIISVTGAHSGVGKTTLCSVLFENLKGFGGIKFTKTSLFTSVIDDARILNEEGKDTAVFLKSGAEKVVWIQSPGSDELENALNIALSKMSGLKGVVIEGNSPLFRLNPCLVIFIVSNSGEIKTSGTEACKRADILILNSGIQEEDLSFLAPMLREQAKIFHMDLTNKKGEIDKFLAYVREYTK
jgi:hypothetical protein